MMNYKSAPLWKRCHVCNLQYDIKPPLFSYSFLTVLRRIHLSLQFTSPQRSSLTFGRSAPCLLSFAACPSRLVR